MTQQERKAVIALSELISLDDYTIEDSPDTDSLVVTFEQGGEL